MISTFKRKIIQAERGKKIFREMFEINKLCVEDAFLFILTDNEDCICLGAKYLPCFIKKHHKRDVYVFMDNIQYKECFVNSGGVVLVCEPDKLDSISAYFDMFKKKEFLDTRIIFLTEKTGYGSSVEELLEKNEFTLEEYVVVSLYQLNLQNLEE